MTQEKNTQAHLSSKPFIYYNLLKKKNSWGHVSLFNSHPQINVDIRVENKMITAAWNISWDLFNFRGRRRMHSYRLVNRPSLSGRLQED